MGEESTSNSKADDNNNNAAKTDGSYETPVILNVYDLTPANQYSVWLGFGIFHSGIEVHGMEYGYGAHDFPISGVFEVEPKSCPGFIYRCSVPLGRIKMPPSEFHAFLEDVASEYHGDTYHLISKNCNHFTDDIAQRLTGKGIPGWVNRLARIGAFCSCLLPESLQATTVKQLPEYHHCTASEPRGYHFVDEATGFVKVCASNNDVQTDPNKRWPVHSISFFRGFISIEEDGSGSMTSTTPHEPTESEDGDQDKHLLSSPISSREVAFIRETQR